MKKIIILLFVVSAIFAQNEQYEKNLNLGNSDMTNYTIVKDDNLWTLAETYYGNPFEWRYIWEHNKYIADPHWIYPGNKLFIPAIQGDVAVSVVSSDDVRLYYTAKTLNQLNDKVKKSPTKSQLYLVEKFKYYFSLEAQRQAPFIYEYNGKNSINIFDYGEVAGGGKPILVQHKDALVKINENTAEQIKIGARFDFYEIRDNLPVRSIKGVITEPVASGAVKFIDDDYTTIFVDKVWGLLSIGAKVAPIRTYKSLGDELTYKVLSDSLEARVIARMIQDVSMKPGEFVFIDKGSNKDISIGDHFVFYEYGRRTSKQKHAGESIAEGLVIAAGNGTATIRITTVKDYSTANSFVGVRQGKIVAK